MGKMVMIASGRPKAKMRAVLRKVSSERARQVILGEVLGPHLRADALTAKIFTWISLSLGGTVYALTPAGGGTGINFDRG